MSFFSLQLKAFPGLAHHRAEDGGFNSIIYSCDERARCGHQAPLSPSFSMNYEYRMFSLLASQLMNYPIAALGTLPPTPYL